MSVHPSTGGVDHNLPVWSVSEVSLALKRHIEGAFDRVRIRGEVSGFKRAASGHLYFALKDADAVIKVVCFRSAATRLGMMPEDGIEVIAGGRLTTYPGRSEYQLVAEAIEAAGEGALLKLIEERKKRLAAEGLFDVARKQPIPFLPDVIGVVTSPTGAVIRDILHRLGDRFPRRVLVWPTLVQGEGAAEQVAAAIAGFNRLPAGGGVPRPDLIIVARGGGSLEDLLPFSEEIVVRAAAASAIPLISAVGHETDNTLIDYAADLRAPTPTAAAEMAVPVRIELAARVINAGGRLIAAMHRLIGQHRTHLAGLARGLPRPRQLLEEARQRFDDRSERLANGLAVGLDRRLQRLAALAARLKAMRPRIDQAAGRLTAESRALDRAIMAVFETRRSRLEQAGALLNSFSYRRVLERGFVLVHDGAGRTLTSVQAAKPGLAVSLQFHDGERGAVISGHGSPPRSAARSAKGKPDDDGQGTLL